MRIVGIDPGLTGGLAIYDSETDVIIDAIDVPTIGVDAKERVDCRLIGVWLIHWKVQRGFVERAQAMPDQGASSGFKYGRGVGYLEAAVIMAGVGLDIIEVRAWKKHFNLAGKDKGGGEAARALVMQRYPRTSELFERKKDHGRAEAVLIAIYGAHLVRDGK
jgi:crossover junction endodeoxyribonuclease RuvC